MKGGGATRRLSGGSRSRVGGGGWRYLAYTQAAASVRFARTSKLLKENRLRLVYQVGRNCHGVSMRDAGTDMVGVLAESVDFVLGGRRRVIERS